MIRRAVRAVAVGLVLVAATACSSGASPSAAAPSAEDSASAPAASSGASELDGTSWSLVDIGGSAIDATALPTIIFATGGAVSGSAGCNTYTGTATIAEGTIDFGPLASTRMACEQPIMDLEARVLAAMDGATTWSISADGNLLIEGGPEPLTYQPAEGS